MDITSDKQNPRQLAFLALRSVHKGAFADVALDRVLKTAGITGADRGLVTELVYGSVRRLRSLDALIDQLGKKKANRQPPDLRTILHLGLYQLCYLSQIPAAAAVNSAVELAKLNGFSGLTGVVNGMLRQYIRSQEPLQLPENQIERLGVLHSFPDWIIQVWLEQLGLEETEHLCTWMNQSPAIDLRVNPLRARVEEVEAALLDAGITVNRVNYLPQALRLTESIGAIQQLPGFREGWWTVQDSSAQLVSYLLAPQSGEVVIDACAAPGGKTTHIAELMEDKGTVWACDHTDSRLKRLHENAQRLNLQSIRICTGDSRYLWQFANSSADRVLLDAPCSGLGTLHRRADARWRQTPATVQELSVLQGQLLEAVATWVKPGGILVYATCTLHPLENEGVIQPFLARHPNWQIEPPHPTSPAAAFTTVAGWLKVWPHQYEMDGFFMVRLKHNS
ncbi:MAG: 16S rRNA (cytosine(967)-C(5))-methyltransferase [Chamaesiphon sp.]